jgi:hypothetical protein
MVLEKNNSFVMAFSYISHRKFVLTMSKRLLGLFRCDRGVWVPRSGIRRAAYDTDRGVKSNPNRLPPS